MDLRRALRWYGGKLMRVGRPKRFTVNGTPVVIHHRATIAHFNTIAQCFQLRQYEIPELGANLRAKTQAYYQAILARGATPLIIDAGANIGAAALWHAAMYPAAHIVAVEPATDNVILLRQNCTTPNIDIRAAAIGPHDGTITLTDPGVGADSYRTVDDPSRGYEVPLISIASIMKDYPSPAYEPFILKVDIEGAEQQLFSGDPDGLAQFPVVAMEPHDWMLPGQQTSVPFFHFHASQKRDFSYHQENLFSFSPALVATKTGRTGPASQS